MAEEAEQPLDAAPKTKRSLTARLKFGPSRSNKNLNRTLP